ncbi:hypothetical protein [Legionella cardiaca]|uniref:Coiled-coil protein n=1 Tax=Legionella cardiaca TaxID=1071983 RepID=A0ABY8AT89_9GAMM|nr:hypothetical protein [Legionella cardiaca]WED43778.1 hypothetical protein PXX05_03080 [Legionella cardiaca]
MSQGKVETAKKAEEKINAEFNTCTQVADELKKIFEEKGFTQEASQIYVYHPTRNSQIYCSDSQSISNFGIHDLGNPEEGGILIIVDENSDLNTLLKNVGFKEHTRDWAAEHWGQVVYSVSPWAENGLPMDAIKKLPTHLSKDKEFVEDILVGLSELANVMLQCHQDLQKKLTNKEINEELKKIYQHLYTLIAQATIDIQQKPENVTVLFKNCISNVGSTLEEIEKHPSLGSLIKESNNPIKRFIQYLCDKLHDKFGIKLESIRPKTTIEKLHNSFFKQYMPENSRENNLSGRQAVEETKQSKEKIDAEFDTCTQVADELKKIFEDNGFTQEASQIYVYHPTRDSQIYCSDSQSVSNLGIHDLGSPEEGGILIVVNEKSDLNTLLKNAGFKEHDRDWASENMGEVVYSISPWAKNGLTMDAINALPTDLKKDLPNNSNMTII